MTALPYDACDVCGRPFPAVNWRSGSGFVCHHDGSYTSEFGIDRKAEAYQEGFAAGREKGRTEGEQANRSALARRLARLARELDPEIIETLWLEDADDPPPLSS